MRVIIKKLISTIAAAALALTVVTLPRAPGSVAEAETLGDCTGNHDGWTVWAGSYFSESGKYYLQNDVTLTGAVSIGSGKDITLCLNGHTVAMSSEKDRGIFEINGGSLTLCDCNSSGSGNGKLTGVNTPLSGGAVYVYDGSFTMNGGTISGNTTSTSGGAVYVNGNSSFTMNGGKISGNTAKSGGAVYMNSGSFTMNGGTISGNTASGGGGAVYMNSGSFTMNGGMISGNEANNNGGGVYFGGTVFEMSGNSVISNNTAKSGGGVYLYSGNFSMSDSTISGNTATSGNGGGVYHNGTFTINGKVDISGNKKDDNSNNNVYLNTSSAKITIGESFNTSSKIGVNNWFAPSCKNLISVTKTGTNDISACFKADIDGQSIVYSDGNVQLSGAHNTTKTEKKEATCTKEGNIEYWKCSTCTKYFSDSDCKNEIQLSDTVIGATGHAYGDWQTTKDATCKAEGTKERTCANCTAKETDTIPKTTTHNYVGGICSVCNAVDPAHTHTGGTATCSKKAVCTICNQEYGELAAHSYGPWSVTKNPTETATGTAQRTCAFGEKETKTDVPNLSDSTVWTKDDNAHVDPTATKPGKDVYTSTTYGTVEVTIPATGGGNSGGGSSGGSSSSRGSGSGSGSSTDNLTGDTQKESGNPATGTTTAILPTALIAAAAMLLTKRRKN